MNHCIVDPFRAWLFDGQLLAAAMLGRNYDGPSALHHEEMLVHLVSCAWSLLGRLLSLLCRHCC